MKLEQLLHEKSLKNDVFRENLVNFKNPNRLSQCFEILHEKTVVYMLSDDTKQNLAI